MPQTGFSFDELIKALTSSFRHVFSFEAESCICVKYDVLVRGQYGRLVVCPEMIIQYIE